MTKKMKRRDFMRNSAVAGLTLAAAKTQAAGFPTILTQSAVKPLVISSANGNRFKNGGTVTGVQKAFTMITGGSDVLDAVIAGVNIVELDPLDDSVGYGGLPNAEGIVQLDSSVMHGPKKRAGAVGAIEGVRTPSLVAKAVMDYTDHHLIVGKGAQDLAQTVARMQASHRSQSLSRPERTRGSGSSRSARDVGGRKTTRRKLARHDQLRRYQLERRNLRRHDNERSRVEDSRPYWRLTDSRRGSLR